MTAANTLKVLAVGFAAGVLTVAVFPGARSQVVRQSEVTLKAECERAIDSDPDISKQKADIESKSLVDLPTIAAHQSGIPSCVRYVRALLSDPDRAQEERWEIEELDRQDSESSAPDLTRIESDLSNIESDLSRR
jgi:hypothetical protein